MTEDVIKNFEEHINGLINDTNPCNYCECKNKSQYSDDCMGCAWYYPSLFKVKSSK